MLDTGYWMLDAGFWILDIGLRILDFGFRIEKMKDDLDFPVHWLLAAYCLLSTAYWILDT